MNYLQLTHDQVEQIHKVYPIFDEPEVRYWGALNCVREIDCYSIDLKELEVKIGQNWHTLIHNEKAFKGAIFDLTDEQYKIIKDELIQQKYD
jgi:hypothetical protein